MDQAEKIKQIKEAAQYIKQFMKEPVNTAIVLGSGLGEFEKNIEDSMELPYKDIPFFPISTVIGHSGKLIIGKTQNKNIIAMSGRFHYYEGYSMETITFPMRVLKSLGVSLVILTNAAGGINTEFNPGDLMIIQDHFKFFDESPLRGPNLDDFGPRFCDMSDVYTKKYREVVKNVANKCGIEIKEGVYAFMPGPSYETPAEIRALRVMGADAVGMSTVPEAIVCAHSSMNVVGISCISNMAAGILDAPLSHKEVMETGKAVSTKFSTLLQAFLREIN